MIEAPTLSLDDKVMAQRRTEKPPRPLLGDPVLLGITREEVFMPRAGDPDVRALLYRPATKHEGLSPGYLHIHGGGYLFGEPEMSDAGNLSICSQLGAVVLSVDYRLAPEHPIPAPLDDCYTALTWLHGRAPALGVDVTRIAVGGASAGGGLAAALALKARDANEYAICHQHLTYPMLDDRTGSKEYPADPLTGEFIWTAQSNQYGWSAYLGDALRAAPQVPSRAASLEGLPPTWMHTVTLDLFRDENIAYANRLMAVGVPTELSVYPGACHGYQGVLNTHLGKRYAEESMNALARGLRCR
jgi:acetyl esterase/lipase